MAGNSFQYKSLKKKNLSFIDFHGGGGWGASVDMKTAAPGALSRPFSPPNKVKLRADFPPSYAASMPKVPVLLLFLGNSFASA